MNKPIRVLQIVTIMERNGYESRIMDIYRNLDRNNIQFDFYTHRKEKGNFDDEIIKLGGKIYYNNSISPLHFLRYLKELDLFFKSNHYDIVHSHLNTYSVWGLLAAKKNGVKIRIAHSRNSGFDRSWKTVFKCLSKILINLPPTHRFACSREAGVWLFGKSFLEDKNSKVIPNAFNCDAFAFNKAIRHEVRSELGISDTTTAVVNVGRFSPPKNHEKILSVFKFYKNKHGNSRLYLFGDGELRDQIHKLVNDMGLSDSVVFMGNRPNVNRYLNAMDIMLFPSFYEGFGTAAIEAQCNGLPVLASDVLSRETQITNLIKYCSLNSPINQWVSDMEELLKANRFDNSEILKNAGFDMQVNAKNMENFYLCLLNS